MELESKLDSERGTAGLTAGLLKEKLFELFNGFCGSAKVYLTGEELKIKIIELYNRYSGISSASEDKILNQIKRTEFFGYNFFLVSNTLNGTISF